MIELRRVGLGDTDASSPPHLSRSLPEYRIHVFRDLGVRAFLTPVSKIDSRTYCFSLPAL